MGCNALQIATLRKNLSTHLDRVSNDGAFFVVQKRKTPYAYLVPFCPGMLGAQNTIAHSICSVRAKIGDLVNKVYYNKLHVIIIKHKEPVAALVPLEEPESATAP